MARNRTRKRMPEGPEADSMRRRLELEIRQELANESRGYLAEIRSLKAKLAATEAKLAEKEANSSPLEELVAVKLSEAPEFVWSAPRSKLIRIATELLLNATGKHK